MKITGNERDVFLKELRAMKEDGYSGEQIIKRLNEKYEVDYKESTFKCLLKESYRDLFTKRIAREEEYMKHCKEEYEVVTAEDPATIEAERLYKIARGIQDEN